MLMKMFKNFIKKLKSVNKDSLWYTQYRILNAIIYNNPSL